MSRVGRARTCGLRIPTLAALASSLVLGLGPGLVGQTRAQPTGPAGGTPRVDERLLLQEIPSVYSASKYDQKVTEAPSSVSIVTAEEIKRFGYRTLADILRSVRGFHTSYDRNYTYLGVRGFARPGDYNSRVLLLIDGHRINENVYDSALIGSEFPLDVDLIDRVEIVRGPSSSLHGNNAFFAVVNVITRRGRDLQGVELSGEGGSEATYKGRVTLGKRFENRFEGILSGSYYTSAGQRRLFFPEFDDPATGAGVARDADGDEFYSTFATLSYRDFTLQALYFSRTKQIPTGSYETVFGDPRAETTDTFGYVDLKFDRTFAVDWRVLARVYYDRYYYGGVYPYPGDPAVVLNRDRTLGDRWGAELQGTTRALPRHVVTLGAAFEHNLHQDQENFDVEPYTPYLDERRDSIRWAVYLQDEFTILPSLLLSAGLRYDHFEGFGGTTNPRLGLICSPLADTTVKLLYGTAFRAPNAYERFYTAVAQKGNPDLKPETIETYELILEQYFWQRRFRGTLVGFYYTIDDLINLETDPVDELLVFRNLGHTTSRGVEIELEGRWPNGLLGRVSYTYQQSRDERTGATLTDSPHHLAKVHVIVPLIREKLFVGAEALYTSARRTRSGGSAGGNVVANVTLFSANLPVKGLELSASVYNVLDATYGTPVSDAHRQEAIEQDGRSFRIKLTYAF